MEHRYATITRFGFSKGSELAVVSLHATAAAAKLKAARTDSNGQRPLMAVDLGSNNEAKRGDTISADHMRQNGDRIL